MAEMEDLGLSKLTTARRRTVSVAGEELVRIEPLTAGQPLPLLVRPLVAGVDLAAWAAAHRETIERELARVGGILFRGFDISSSERLEGVVKALYGQLLEYSDRVQPRSVVADKVYTSTEFPPEHAIDLHNEAAYAYTWPQRIFFCCLLPAESGGATPIADCRKVLSRIDRQVLKRFIDQRVMYVRNLGDGFGITWQTAFQTDDRAEMEAFCRRTGVELEWKGGDRLRTRSVRPVVVRHPTTCETVWFNAAVSSHDSTLDPAVRAALLSEFRPDELPKNCFYGDGTPIEDQVMEELRRACREETVTFPWQRGDVLLLDNMLVAHGREPYGGPRKVIVAMAVPTTQDQV